MKYLKRQEGMVLPLVVGLVAVVLVVVGVAVYQSQQAKTKQATASPTPTPAAEASPTPGATASWKTMTSPLAKFSIKYPNTWSFRTATNNGGAETIYITSPSNFEIELISFTSTSTYGKDSLRMNPSGSCGSACIAKNSSDSFNSIGYGQLSLDAVTYGASGGTVNQLMLRTPADSLYIVSPKAADVRTSVTALFQGMTQQQNTQQTPTQFASEGDVQTAMQILKTLFY